MSTNRIDFIFDDLSDHAESEMRVIASLFPDRKIIYFKNRLVIAVKRNKSTGELFFGFEQSSYYKANMLQLTQTIMKLGTTGLSIDCSETLKKNIVPDKTVDVSKPVSLIDFLELYRQDLVDLKYEPHKTIIQ